MTDKILHHLKVKRSAPTIEYLQELITAYCSTVPWESVSKIVKKGLCEDTSTCLRLEDEFWSSALQNGTGGTCYESNWAFLCFLQTLGFEGYLTINKIADKSSVHAAIVVTVSDRKYIVDIGYPIYAPILITTECTTLTTAGSTTYRATAISETEYIIENFPHPKPYLYHLTDIAVSSKDYLKVAADDYGEAGLFADRIVIRKVVDKVATRFDSEDILYNIHTLQNGEKRKTYLNAENLISSLSSHFKLNMQLLREAFVALKIRIPYSNTHSGK